MIVIEDTDRLSPRIAHARKCLAARVRLDGAGPLPDSVDLAAFERGLDNSLSEHFAYQNAQSRAFAAGKLSLYEAQVIYIALGEAPGASGWAADTDLATKLIVTEALAEIVRGQIVGSL